MEKIILSSENIEKNREAILAAYQAPQKRSNRLPVPTKKQKKLLGIGGDRGIATAKYIRISPSKARIVVDLIKGQSIDDAYAILNYTPKAAAPVIKKVLKAAEASAVNDKSLNRDNLYVADAYANPGPILRRWMPRARGSASGLNKRSCHITVVLKERV